MLAALEFLGDGVFWNAVVVGAAGTAIVALVAMSSNRATAVSAPVPLAGYALVVPAAFVIDRRFELPDGAVAGLLALGLAGVLVDLHDVSRRLGILLALPGAWLLAWHADLVPVTWIRWTVLGTSIIGGAALASFDRRWGGRGYPPVFFALAAAGVYYTVPDPYEALVLFGCALPVLLLGWPRPLARFGAAGALMAAGLLAWTVARGGFGRQSSIVGGVACLGLLVLEPAARLRGRGWSPLALIPRGSLRWPLAAGGQLACVVVASRLAGLQSPAPYHPGGPLWRGAVAPAVAVVLVEAAIVLLVMEALRRRDDHARRRRSPRA